MNLSVSVWTDFEPSSECYCSSNKGEIGVFEPFPHGGYVYASYEVNFVLNFHLYDLIPCRSAIIIGRFTFRLERALRCITEREEKRLEDLIRANQTDSHQA